MSWQAFEAVQDHSQFEDSTALCILYALARSANPSGVVGAGGKDTSPNIDTIAGRAHVHRNTVLNWLPKLEASGELKVERFGKGRGAWNRHHHAALCRRRNRNRRNRSKTNAWTGWKKQSKSWQLWYKKALPPCS